MKSTDNKEKKEGWGYLFNSTKWHYFRDGRSLCKKWMILSSGELEEGNNDSKDNCFSCRRALLAEIDTLKILNLDRKKIYIDKALEKLKTLNGYDHLNMVKIPIIKLESEVLLKNIDGAISLINDNYCIVTFRRTNIKSEAWEFLTIENYEI